MSNVLWTDDRIKQLLDSIDLLGTPSPGHTAFAALMTVRDSYEAELAVLRAKPDDVPQRATYFKMTAQDDLFAQYKVLFDKGYSGFKLVQHLARYAEAGTYNRLTAEIEKLQEIISELRDALDFAAQYRGIEGRSCPLCTYEDGVFIKSCQMHEDMDAQRQRIYELETELNETVSAHTALVLDEYRLCRRTAAAATDERIAALRYIIRNAHYSASDKQWNISVSILSMILREMGRNRC